MPTATPIAFISALKGLSAVMVTVFSAHLLRGVHGIEAMITDVLYALCFTLSGYLLAYTHTAEEHPLKYVLFRLLRVMMLFTLIAILLYWGVLDQNTLMVQRGIWDLIPELFVLSLFATLCLRFLPKVKGLLPLTCLVLGAASWTSQALLSPLENYLHFAGDLIAYGYFLPIGMMLYRYEGLLLNPLMLLLYMGAIIGSYFLQIEKFDPSLLFNLGRILLIVATLFALFKMCEAIFKWLFGKSRLPAVLADNVLIFAGLSTPIAMVIGGYLNHPNGNNTVFLQIFIDLLVFCLTLIPVLLVQYFRSFGKVKESPTEKEPASPPAQSKPEAMPDL